MSIHAVANIIERLIVTRPTHFKSQGNEKNPDKVLLSVEDIITTKP